MKTAVNHILKFAVTLLLLTVMWSCQSNRAIVSSNNDDLYLRPSDRAGIRQNAVSQQKNSDLYNRNNNQNNQAAERSTQNPNAEAAAEYYNPNYSSSGSDSQINAQSGSTGNTTSGGGTVNNYYGTVNQFGSGFGSGWIVNPYWGFGPGLGWVTPLPWRNRAIFTIGIGWGWGWYNPWSPWVFDPFWGPSWGWNIGWGWDPFWGWGFYPTFGWGWGWNAYYAGWWNGYWAGSGGWIGGNEGGNRPTVVNRPRGSMGSFTGTDPVVAGRRERGTGNMPTVNTSNRDNRVSNSVGNSNGAFIRPRNDDRVNNNDVGNAGNRPSINSFDNYRPSNTPESYTPDGSRSRENANGAFVRPRNERIDAPANIRDNGGVDYYAPPSQRGNRSNQLSPTQPSNDVNRRMGSDFMMSPSRQNNFDRPARNFDGGSFGNPSRSFDGGGGSFRSASPGNMGGGGVSRPRGR